MKYGLVFNANHLNKDLSRRLDMVFTEYWLKIAIHFEFLNYIEYCQILFAL